MMSAVFEQVTWPYLRPLSALTASRVMTSTP
jgi:hypothetical protein